MPVINRIADYHDEMTEWRQDFHAHPETAFEETRTAAIIADKLREFSIDVHEGLAGTGVIGTLSNGDGPSIGLRADMDALDILEKTNLPYASTHAGKMHACGHDGHVTMLLGAAKYLAETKNFKGTIHFIFQPAEELAGGGRKMVQEGLFDQFPCDQVFGMHNRPGLPLGEFAICTGPMMAGNAEFEIRITGKGCHAASPHLGIDTVVVAAEIICCFQTITSRNIHPLKSSVVSVTQIHGGDAMNVIPDDVVLHGTARFFLPEVMEEIESRMRQISEGICSAHGASMTFEFTPGYPCLVNHETETEFVKSVAADIVGGDKVDGNLIPTMGVEDFSYLLNERPGAYINIGNGPSDGDKVLHNPHYNFNDDALPMGATYWSRLAETALPR